MGWFSWFKEKIDKTTSAILDFFGVERRPDHTDERIYYTYKFSTEHYKKLIGYDKLPEERKLECDFFCANIEGCWLFDKRQKDYDCDLYVCVEGKDGKVYTIYYPYRSW